MNNTDLLSAYLAELATARPAGHLRGLFLVVVLTEPPRSDTIRICRGLAGENWGRFRDGYIVRVDCHTVYRYLKRQGYDAPTPPPQHRIGSDGMHVPFRPDAGGRNEGEWDALRPGWQEDFLAEVVVDG